MLSRTMTDRSPSSPEFFADRGLGKVTIRKLRERGWLIHTFDAVFANDGQEVSDEEWVTYAGQNGWAGLTKDKRIRHQPAYQTASTPIFALSDGQLTIAEMVARFEAAEGRIWAAAGKDQREFWIVYAGGRVERRDP